MYLTTTRRRSCRTLSRLRSEEEGGFLFLQNPLSRARFLRPKSKREQNLHCWFHFKPHSALKAWLWSLLGPCPHAFCPSSWS